MAKMGPGEAGGGCSQSRTPGGQPPWGHSHIPPPGSLEPAGVGQGLPAAGRRGPHRSRPWESSLRNPEASGGLWPGFLCSWVLLHAQSPGNTTSHSRVHLPRPGSHGAGQPALGEGRAPGIAGGGAGLGGRWSHFPGMEGELTRGRASTLHMHFHMRSSNLPSPAHDPPVTHRSTPPTPSFPHPPTHPADTCTVLGVYAWSTALCVAWSRKV